MEHGAHAKDTDGGYGRDPDYRPSRAYARRCRSRRSAAPRRPTSAPGTRYRVYQNVARYRGDRAHAYLVELKAQLARCGVSGHREGFAPVAEDHLGPDTVLFYLTYNERGSYVGYVVAAVGQYVVVLMMSDSYLGAADLTLLNGLASAAMRRAAAA